MIKFPNDFIQLPGQDDLNEYSIMKGFCYSIEDEDIKNRALLAIKGKGVFQRFKELMQYRDLINEWYKYREKALRQKVIEWCKDNDISYE